MPFEIIRNDIVNMKVDAVVNTANHKPVVGYGVDTAIHKKAGPQLLLRRKEIGDIPFGNVAITDGFDLKAKYVIHAVSPVWIDGKHNEEKLLENCYVKALDLAKDNKCKSIAFPLLAAGSNGFSSKLAMQIAIRAISDFLTQNEMQVYLVVYDKTAFSLSEQLFNSVKSYIDENYIQEEELKEYGIYESNSEIIYEDIEERPSYPRRQREKEEFLRSSAVLSENVSVGAVRIEDLFQKLDKPFSEYLLELIDRKGLTDPQVYKKANIDRKLFNKIKNTKNYKPSKITAVAFAIALELNLDETKDLIGRAGFALSHSNLFDVIIEAFIVEGNYNIFAINTMLFEYDQPLLK